ncbi:sigma 54-interacting transcriptional regulator [Xanthomarina sp. F2636L]|uniref:sigma 54-interacting transcriptional regulator n=1 Tax=Xanthomarina sp. F2636L TaxID=2996018 RepID=UPI00225DFCED|nr:sigma 54-interacting transcriptional regulator [Xanthomarina sp. F2636L]MCX7550895.1 sigma 54-interacting transcriptional regulator [Xanthomarina sp. F2636L]
MNNKTILIVDDTFENLYLLRVILEEAGYLVIEANNGSEGLEKLQENKQVDLIISDILMPVMDGYMFCQACKNEKLFKEIPFVFYTSTYTEKLDEDFAIKLGAVHFLRKPTDQDKILQVIQDIFKNEVSKTKPIKKSEFTEQEVLKLYSKRLISKLEQKNLDLENEISERKKAEQLLIHKNEILDLLAVNTSLGNIFDRLLLNYESVHPNYFGSISLLDEDGIHLNLESAPSMPKSYNLAIKRVPIGKNTGSCGTAAFIKKPVIVSDISKDKLWKDYKDIALEYGLKSCWSLPIFSKNKIVLGTFAIYSKSISTPSLDEINELNFAVNLVRIAIEKSRTVAEIKKKDESYKALINQASDAIMSYSLDGTIHSFNKSSYINLGYTKKEFQKLNIKDLVVGDFVINSERYKELLKEKPLIFDREIIRKDKSILVAEISAKMQKDGRILAICRDVTETKKNIREVKKEKEFSAGLLKSMGEGLLVINLNSEIIRVNPSFCEMTGFTEKELLGVKRPYPFWSPELKKENDERYELLIQDKNERDYEIVYMHKNGKYFPVRISISSIFNEEGEKIANFSIVQDITQRRNAEIKLKESEKSLLVAQKLAKIGSYNFDINTQILEASSAFKDIVGVDLDSELSPEIWREIRHPDDSAINQEMLERSIKTGEKFDLEYRILTKNNKELKWIHGLGEVTYVNGQVANFFGTIQDITERKVVEMKLIDSEYNLKQSQIVGNIGSYSLDIQTMMWESSDILDKIMDINKSYIRDLNGWVSIIHPDEREQMLNYFENNILIKHEKFNREYRIVNHVDDKEKWVHGLGKLILDSEGNPVKMIGTIQDITDRKIAENKIAKANEQLKQVNKELNVLRNQLEQENVYLRNELDLVFNYEEMVYGSAEFSNLLSEVEKVAPTTATVLLLGESGTGKELLARAIHNTSLRNNKPLIKVNCSAIPRELIESELFGHKKGSFTGAITDKIGKFELADGGTLFLDEIGELPLDMQPKILRFLQEGEIEVVGGTSGLKKLDVRVIAATNRNLKEEVDNKRFREDLYFRLNVFPIEVPPLRKRIDDIPLLVEHFVDKFNKAYGKSIKFITDESMSKLKAYKWPGNIRELENLIERASILSTNNTLLIPGFESSTQNTKPINNRDLSLDKAQRNHILQVLEQCNWKISGPHGASILLDLKPSTLRDKMTKLGISKPK